MQLTETSPPKSLTAFLRSFQFRTLKGSPQESRKSEESRESNTFHPAVWSHECSVAWRPHWWYMSPCHNNIAKNSTRWHSANDAQTEYWECFNSERLGRHRTLMSKELKEQSELWCGGGLEMAGELGALGKRQRERDQDWSWRIYVPTLAMTVY